MADIRKLEKSHEKLSFGLTAGSRPSEIFGFTIYYV
jgi:hypothetical protein